MFRRILYCIFISVVGECFSTGRKWKGVLLLISFAALPLFALITYTMLSGFFDIKVRTYFFSFVFIVYFLFIWVVGKSGNVRHCVDLEVRPLSFGVACASMFFWALVVMGWFFCVIQPLLSKDSKPGEVEVFSWTSRSSPSMLPFESNQVFQGSGNVIFVGAIVDSYGKPVSNYEMVIIFNNYKMGGRVLSNNDGSFSFRMPPGVWRFDGLHAGSSSFKFSHKKDGLEKGGDVFVDQGGQDRVIRLYVELD